MEIAKIFIIQSIMDSNYKNVLLNCLKNGEHDLGNQMNTQFPESRWVCHVETRKRPFLEITAKWPS
jgi:hypothetical protein